MTGPQELETILELEITAVAHGGDGVGRVRDVVCFVAGALPGDFVRVRVYRRAKNALWGKVLQVLTPSAHRIMNSDCREAACTSACMWHDFAYPEQAHWKRRIVTETLERLGGQRVEVAWVEMPEYRLGYRTRATFHGDGRLLGYYASRTHDVVSFDACPLNHPHLNEAFAILQPLRIKGDVHVTVNPESDDKLIWMRRPNEAVRAAFLRVNTAADTERARFFFDGVPVVNGAFSQSSLLLNRLLRHETDACIDGAASLLDLYCGNGNLSLHHGEHTDVLGIDHAEVAVEAAQSVANNGHYRRGDETVMAAVLHEHPWDVVLLDPPRVGARPLMSALATANAKRIVYVSCNPATLARDLRFLCPRGWQLVRATAIDMFPHTPHVETVCLLQPSGKNT